MTVVRHTVLLGWCAVMQKQNAGLAKGVRGAAACWGSNAPRVQSVCIKANMHSSGRRISQCVWNCLACLNQGYSFA